jgi:two-component system response regulator PilR (NtrC family)
LLVDYFIKKTSKDMGIEPKRISVEAMRVLEGYFWPGNVRELENVIERALALSTDENISLDDIPMQLVQGGTKHPSSVEIPDEGLDLENYLDGIRRQVMGQALSRCDGVQTQAAELLGMTFRSFRYYAKKMGLTRSLESDSGDLHQGAAE